MRKICIIGTGYVGLVYGATFADHGNEVACLDIDEAKVERLRRGEMPIYEPGLAELVQRNTRLGRLTFTTSYPEALDRAEFAFICVNTPSGSEGEADMRAVRSAIERLAEVVTQPITVINKSTVPIGTGDWMTALIARKIQPGLKFWVVSNPEFLREGNALHDLEHPDRIVLGASDPEAARRVAKLYEFASCEIIETDIRTAEMIKYASNAFLATKISFINEIASICERLGANVADVGRGMGLDERIGLRFLNAGLGWGGSCFPKDVKALAHMASIHGCHPQLLRAVMEINRDQRRRVVKLLRDRLGSLQECTIGLLGLAFKPDTDDLREAPAVEIAHLLQAEGATIRAYDPVAMERARLVLPDIELVATPYDLARGADALVLVTEWKEFRDMDKAKIRGLMRQGIFVDGRNMYDPAEMVDFGFDYASVGRPTPAFGAASSNGHGEDHDRVVVNLDTAGMSVPS